MASFACLVCLICCLRLLQLGLAHGAGHHDNRGAQHSNLSALWTSREFLLHPWWVSRHNYSIVFNKIMKCASSTAAGVLRAVAYHSGLFSDTQLDNMTIATNRTTRTAIANRSRGVEVDLWPFKYATYIKNEPFVLATHAAAHEWQTLQRVSK